MPAPDHLILIKYYKIKNKISIKNYHHLSNISMTNCNEVICTFSNNLKYKFDKIIIINYYNNPKMSFY